MIPPAAKPRLARGVRLQQDQVRGGWNLLAPERVLRINGSSVDILALCDGTRTLGEIVDVLHGRYRAERSRIEHDATLLLESHALKLVVEL